MAAGEHRLKFKKKNKKQNSTLIYFGIFRSLSLKYRSSDTRPVSLLHRLYTRTSAIECENTDGIRARNYPTPTPPLPHPVTREAHAPW